MSLKPEIYLYLISEGEDGPVKIGMAHSPSFRLRALQIGNPRRLKLAASWGILLRSEGSRAEAHIHRIMRRCSIHCGGEWYRISEKDGRELIEAAIRDTKINFVEINSEWMDAA